MTKLNIEDSLILIIDVQEKLLNSVFNKESCGKKAAIVAEVAKILEIPVVVTEQYPKGLGETVTEVKNALSVNTKYFEKTSFSAYDEIANVLNDKKQIVVFGIETHICVSQTVEALINNGYEVHVVEDACGSRAETEYSAGLERIRDNGAHIITTEIALFEWLGSAKHPKFKEVQTLIK